VSCGLPQQTSCTSIHNKNKHPLSQPKQWQSGELEPPEAMEGNDDHLKYLSRSKKRDGGLQRQQTTP